MRSIKKISAIVGSTLLVGGVVAAISVTTTSCTPKLTHIKFSDCIQKGGVSGESDSKSIDVNFKGYEGADLLANDFTITDKLDASKTITPTSAEYISVGRYTLELPKTPTWDNAENVFISINKDSFVTDTLGATTLYTNPSWTHINFGACTANGDDGTDNTTSINVRFTGYSGNVLLSSGVFTITDDTDSSKTISATAAYVGPGQYTLSITETSD
ncbi:hypothetical protein FACS1894166_04870 [Bacilli bacterium]|nr:hypothetical protein FACS1894166_04870 [Bacilli bacterium]